MAEVIVLDCRVLFCFALFCVSLDSHNGITRKKRVPKECHGRVYLFMRYPHCLHREALALAVCLVAVAV